MEQVNIHQRIQKNKQYITPTGKKNETKTQLLFVYLITMFQVVC